VKRMDEVTLASEMSDLLEANVMQTTDTETAYVVAFMYACLSSVGAGTRAYEVEGS
jgi:hypothetical protein